MICYLVVGFFLMFEVAELELIYGREHFMDKSEYCRYFWFLALGGTLIGNALPDFFQEIFRGVRWLWLLWKEKYNAPGPASSDAD